MKQWPEEQDKTISCEDALKPIAKIIRTAYTLKATGKPLKYTGYDTGRDCKVGCPPPDVMFKLAEDKEQGRTILDTALLVAFQLGIEQGRRLMMKDAKMAEIIVRSEGLIKELNAKLDMEASKSK